MHGEMMEVVIQSDPAAIRVRALLTYLYKYTLLQLKQQKLIPGV